ncbi:MAG: hypothetical protein MJE68_29510 [Proteobacteria bacterium]|nr:hypothetical protein [Pseudomonadota bacterium]
MYYSIVAIELYIMMMLTDSSLPLDLNNLLDQIGEEVASEWYQLGRAVGISEEMLDECSNRSPQEAVVEVLDYWIRNHNPSWEDVSEMLNEVGLRELANSFRQG